MWFSLNVDVIGNYNIKAFWLVNRPMCFTEIILTLRRLSKISYEDCNPYSNQRLSYYKEIFLKRQYSNWKKNIPKIFRKGKKSINIKTEGTNKTNNKMMNLSTTMSIDNINCRWPKRIKARDYQVKKKNYILCMGGLL